MEEQKMQDLKMQDQMSPHENAKPENEGPNDGAWKCINPPFSGPAFSVDPWWTER